LTVLDAHAGFVQFSKSSQAHLIRKNNVLVLEKFLYDEE